MMKDVPTEVLTRAEAAAARVIRESSGSRPPVRKTPESDGDSGALSPHDLQAMRSAKPSEKNQPIGADSKVQIRAGVLIGLLWGITWTLGGWVFTQVQGHEGRITVLEEKRKYDDRATEQAAALLEKRLDRIEAKIDALSSTTHKP